MPAGLAWSSSVGNREALRRVLHQRAGRRAIVEAFAAAGAFLRHDLVEVARLQQFRPDRRFRADFAAQPAGIADRVVDRNLHLAATGWGERPNPPIWCSR